MRKTKPFFFALWLNLWALAAFAQQTSSIDPQYPATDGDITSYGLRKNFLAAYQDINTLFSQVNLPPLGANQIFLSLVPGIPSGFTMPGCAGATNALIYTQGVGFGCNTLNPSGFGTVQSVGLTMPSVLFNSPVPGSPVTIAGTLAPTLANQNANAFFRGPTSGAAASPTFGPIVGADLPAPTSGSFGGVNSFAPIAHNFIEGLGTNGSFIFGQPAFSDLSGTISASQYSLATSSAVGAVQPDNSTIVISGGIISATNTLPSLNSNQVLGSLTTGTPSGLTLPSCFGGSNAITWQPGTGFLCNNISGSFTGIFSSLIAANATNSIDNANFAQTWAWNSLGANTALAITASASSGTALSITLTGAANTGNALSLANTSSSGDALSITGVTETNGSISQTSYTVPLVTSTFTPDFSKANDLIIPLVHASCPCAIANPINTQGVQDGTIEIDQSATGSDTVTWGSAYKFPGGVSPILSTTSGAQDYFGYHEKDSTHVIVGGPVLNAH